MSRKQQVIRDENITYPAGVIPTLSDKVKIAEMGNVEQLALEAVSLLKDDAARWELGSKARDYVSRPGFP